MKELEATVLAYDRAVKATPRGIPWVSSFNGVTLHKWPHNTTSLGVEKWLRDNGQRPITRSELALLEGYLPTVSVPVALVALGEPGPFVYVLHERDGKPTIDRADRIYGASDDLSYPGWDWVEGVLFPSMVEGDNG